MTYPINGEDNIFVTIINKYMYRNRYYQLVKFLYSIKQLIYKWTIQ
jgi:hypothetical protein